MQVLAVVLALVLGGVAVAAAPPACAGQYANCTEAREDGVCGIPEGDDNYDPDLDRDDDGIACECPP